MNGIKKILLAAWRAMFPTKAEIYSKRYKESDYVIHVDSTHGSVYVYAGGYRVVEIVDDEPKGPHQIKFSDVEDYLNNLKCWYAYEDMK